RASCGISSSPPSHLPLHPPAVAQRYSCSTKPTPAWSCRRRARREGLLHTCAPVPARVPSSLPACQPFHGSRLRGTLETPPEPLQRADQQAQAAGPRGDAESRRWGRRRGAPTDTGAKIPFDLPIRAVTGRKGEHLAQCQRQRFLQVPQTVTQTIAHHLLVQKRPPAALIARDALPGQRPVTPAQFGHVQVSNGAVLREQCTLVAATAGRVWGAPPRHMFIAI